MGDVIQFPTRTRLSVEVDELCPKWRAYHSERCLWAKRHRAQYPPYIDVLNDWRNLLARGEAQAELDRLILWRKQTYGW